MPLQELQSMDHLVHIGFDRKEQPEFTWNVKERIEKISDSTSHILNFVDETDYHPDDLEDLQILRIADALRTFLCSCQLQSMFSGTDFDTSKPLEEIPQELLLEIQTSLDGTYQKIQQGVKSYNDWIDKDFLITPLPKEIQEEVDIHDAVFQDIMGAWFGKYLNHLVQHFKGKNIFGIETVIDARNDDVANKERKEEIVEYAQKLLGSERILFSTMKDAEVNRIVDAITAEADDKKRKKMLKESRITLEEREKDYGNATQYLLEIGRNLTIQRAKRSWEKFTENIETLWYMITHATQHILWGEYYGRCVHSWRSNLELYWIKKENIEILSHSSLIPMG